MRKPSNDLDIDLEEDTGYFSKDIEYDEWDESKMHCQPLIKIDNFRQIIWLVFLCYK